MPLLSEVFDLVDRYHAYGVKLNIETKVEAGAPPETAPREQFVQVVAREIRAGRTCPPGHDPELRLGLADADAPGRPQLPLVALTNKDFLQVGQPGKSPWLGGIDIDDFGGDPSRRSTSFGCAAVLPGARLPAERHDDGPGVRPYVTADMVRRRPRGRHEGHPVDRR